MSNTFLWANIFNQSKKEDILDILKKVPIFEDCTRGELKAIERILHHRSYREGEMIFRTGEIGVGMYIIEHGQVGIVADKTERQISLLTDGEFFGEIALLNEEPRSAHAVARADTTVFGFFRPDLFSLLERKPHLGVSVVMKLSKVIATRLQLAINENQRLYDRIAELTSA